jgi:pimeloyl-ACP methyl ester carboxylesterase
MNAPPVRYTRTSDGYSIAFSETGSGQAFLLTPHAFSHIQLYWEQPSFLLPWFRGLAERFRLIQLDWRGQGMSSRGLREDFVPEDLVRDIGSS